MSLLTSAHPYESSNSRKREKFTPRMTDTFKKLTSEFTDSVGPTEKTSFEKDLEKQKMRDTKVNNMLNSMNQSVQGFQDGDGLGNFTSKEMSHNPPPLPSLPSLQPPSNTSNMSSSSTVTSYTPFQNKAASSYSQSYGPTSYSKQVTAKQENFSNMLSSHGNSSSHEQQLLEKLNYMIHLLEAQQKEPTQNIVEEFLLYGLLGIFIIFLVDSFTRVGKYTR